MQTKELVFENAIGNIVTTSLVVAGIFGKDHISIVDDIKTRFYMEEAEIEDDEEGELQFCFYKSTYVDSNSETRSMFEMNIDGFEILVNAYSGSDALKSKADFIRAFNRLDPPILNTLTEITKEQEAAILKILDSNTEEDRLFKKALVKSLIRRTKSLLEMNRKIMYFQEKFPLVTTDNSRSSIY